MRASSSLQMKEVLISWSAILIVPVPLVLVVLVVVSSSFPHFLTSLSGDIESAPGSDTLFHHQQQESMTLKRL